MKNIKKLVASVLIGVSLVSFAGCSVVEKTPEAKQKQVVATIGDKKITREEIDKTLEESGTLDQLKSSYGEDYESTEEGKTAADQARQSALDSLVQTEVLTKYANENKLVPSEDEKEKTIKEKAEEQYNQTKEQYGDDEAFKSALEMYGYTEDSLKEEITKNIEKNLEAQLAYDEISEAINKDIKLEEYNEDNFKEKDFRKENKDAVLIQYIVTQDAESGENAKKKLDEGTSFVDVAKEFNADSSKDNGGYMGAVTEDSQLDKQFIDKALALKEGETSEIFHGEEGGSYETYSFIVKRITLDEAIPFAKVADKTTFEATAASTQSSKQNEALTNKMEELKEKYGVKTYKDKLSN